MDEYFESLLSDKDINKYNNVDDWTDEMLTPTLTTTEQDASTGANVTATTNNDADATITTNDADATTATNTSATTAATTTTGGAPLTPPPEQRIILYSFIRPLITNMKTFNIRDLTPDITKIIIDTHKQLPNEFTTSTSITAQLTTAIIDLIKNESKDFKVFFFPALPISSTFDLTQIFKSKELSSYITIFINPTFSVMMEQLLNDYKESSFRLTINQDLTYILKNYHETNESTKQSITYTLDELKKYISRAKSAFIDENDFNETIDTFHHALSSKPPDTTPSIIFTNISTFTTVFDLPDTTSSTISKLNELLTTVTLEPAA